jgi:repressor LexA
VITRRQKQVLEYLRGYVTAHGYAPTIDEVRRHLSLGSLATVHKHLRALEARGAIRRLPHHSRALEVVKAREGPRAVRVPLLGLVAAGTPIEPIENTETVALPEELVGRRPSFALRVRGDSMTGEGILDGDLIVVEPRPEVRNGSTVVAVVRGEATVKKLFREDGRVRLEPANPRLRPIVAPASEVEIRGVVVAVWRRYRQP